MFTLNGRDHLFFWYGSCGIPHTQGGCLIGIRRTLHKLAHFSHQVLLDGRLHRVLGCVEGFEFMVINVHIKPGLDREHVKACWNSVATECSAHPAALAICIGDMNAISEGEGRFDMREGMVYHGDVWRDRTFWETCSDFIEVFNQRQRVERCVTRLSFRFLVWIDALYVGAHRT